MYCQAIQPLCPLYKGPLNEFVHARHLVNANFTDVVTPNSDTLYSGAWLDVRTEPMVLSLPDIKDKRYYSVQVIDAYTHNMAILGARKTGYHPGNYLIAGPKWQGTVPNGMRKVLRSESEYLFVLIRTYVDGEDDIPNVVKIQSGYILSPLSEFVGLDPPTPLPKPDFPPVVASQLQTSSFFKIANFFMAYA